MKFFGLAAGQAWLLLAGSAIAVVLLYLLKPSPRRLVIASNLIWQRMLRERKQEPERLRWWISLLLALAIALALALALSRPEIAAIGGTAEDRIVVIDNSPSMAARNGDGRTRLQLALERAADIVRAGGAGSRFLITDTMHQLPAAGFVSRASALAQLRTIEPRAGISPWFPDAGSAPAPSGDAADSIQQSGVAANPRRLWLVTDGVAPLQPPAGTQVVSVFQSAPNVGITAFEVRAVPSDARQHEAFIQVTNAAAGPTQVEVQLAAGGEGETPVVRVLRVQGNASASLVLDASGFGEGPLRASVRSDADALDLDNTAYAYLPGKSRVRVALVTPGNAELARVLRLLPRIEVEVLSPLRVGDLGRFDAAILDRVVPAQTPPVPALLIAPGRAPWLASRTNAVTDTRIERWDATHPLLSGVALRDVLIDRAATPQVEDAAAVPAAAMTGLPARGTAAPESGAVATLPPGGAARALALIAVARGPANEALILATRTGPRIAVLSFALEASNFALQPSFPGFLANTVDWLTRAARADSQRLGLVSLPISGARVLDLDGNAVPTREVPGATLFEAAKPGLYTAVARDQRIPVAVNVLDARTTAINDTSAARAVSPAATAASAVWTLDPWLVLLLAAVALLAGEWWTYHRRLTV